MPSIPELGEALESLEIEARRLWPNTFAGLWIDEVVDDAGEHVTQSILQMLSVPVDGQVKLLKAS